jgi:Ca2+-binding EF-hand superfamily protein
MEASWDKALAYLDLAEQLEALCRELPQDRGPQTEPFSAAEMFRSLDRNSNGRVELTELADLLEAGNRKVETERLKELITWITGSNESTSLEPTELAILLRLGPIAAPEERLQERFSLMDCDGSGLISRVELHLCLQALGIADAQDDDSIEEMIAAVDSDGDGCVDKEEFRKLFQVAENRQRRFASTSMPDRDWWESLWQEPADILIKMGLRSGMSMLDIGCGYGLFTLPAAKLLSPCRVVGLDIDAEVLKQAESLADQHTNCSFIWGDLKQLSYTFKTPFDLVFIHSTLHGIEDKERVVREVHATLRVGGTFAIVNWLPIPREQTIWRGQPRGPKHEVRMGAQKTVELVTGTIPSFRLERTVTLPPFHYGLIFKRDN